MNREELIVEAGREEHIARHNVTLLEAEEVFYNPRSMARRTRDPMTREPRLRLTGQTEAGRYLTVYMAEVESGRYSLITARDATNAERRLFVERRIR